MVNFLCKFDIPGFMDIAKEILLILYTSVWSWNYANLLRKYLGNGFFIDLVEIRYDNTNHLWMSFVKTTERQGKRLAELEVN